MSGEYNFRNLVLWQKAQQLAQEIVTVVAGLPPGPLSAVVGRQLLASATSIGANVAEGHGRFSVAAHRYHLSIAKGSACETDGWLDLLRRTGHLDVAAEDRLHQQCLELIRMLTAKILALERAKAGASTIRENGPVYDACDYSDDAAP
jgi:four helix bundle protein